MKTGNGMQLPSPEAKDLAAQVVKLELCKIKLEEEIDSQSLLIERLYEEKRNLMLQLKEIGKLKDKFEAESVTFVFDPIQAKGKNIVVELSF